MSRLQNDSKPYSFVLNFEGDDSRTYFLTAYSESEMGGWMKAIQMARYVLVLLCCVVTHCYIIVSNIFLLIPQYDK